MKELSLGLLGGACSPGRAVLAGLVGALANSAAIRLSRALGVEAGTSGLSKWLAVHLNDWFHLGLPVHLRPPAQEAFHTAVGILAGLRHAAPRSLAGAGHIEGTVIQALRHLGPENIDAATTKHLRQILTVREKSSLSRETINAPGWLVPILLKVTRPEEEAI